MRQVCIIALREQTHLWWLVKAPPNAYKVTNPLWHKFDYVSNKGQPIWHHESKHLTWQINKNRGLASFPVDSLQWWVGCWWSGQDVVWMFMVMGMVPYHTSCATQKMRTSWQDWWDSWGKKLSSEQYFGSLFKILKHDLHFFVDLWGFLLIHQKVPIFCWTEDLP